MVLAPEHGVPTRQAALSGTLRFTGAGKKAERGFVAEFVTITEAP